MSRPSGNVSKGLLALAGLAVSAVFLWLAVRNADLDAVRKKLEAADLGLILVAVVVLGLGYAFQAARWKRIADTRQDDRSRSRPRRPPWGWARSTEWS